MIPYLSDFWNAITGATTYGVAWFQDVGNAVAGALGYLLLLPLQVIVDFILGLAYILAQLYVLISIFFAPVYFAAAWLVGIANAINQNYQTQTLITAPDGLLMFLNGLPLFPELMIILAAAMWILAIKQTLEIIKH